MTNRRPDLAAAIAAATEKPRDRTGARDAYREAIGAEMTTEVRRLAELVENNPNYPLTEQQRHAVGTYRAHQAQNEGDDQ